jgi:diphosphomevalonate decarboxylase
MQSENTNNTVLSESQGKGPINIAIIKYWGKENEEEIVPLNNSISITLDMENAFTETSAKLIKSNEHNAENLTPSNILYLNGQEEKISKRVLKIINYFREKTNKEYAAADLIITSRNSFPTAAGCASSASSMACLVKVLSKLFLNDSLDNYELSHLARLGSGSACRSVWGGFVEWEKHNEQRNNSIAVQIVDENYWPDMNILLLTVSEKKKDTSSTDGMKTSKETSELLKCRLDSVLPKRLPEMRQAIKERNFDKVCELTIKDSNNFHAICRDTFPTIIYMNDITNCVVRCVEKINAYFNRWICAYTVDAGPNVFLLVQKENVELVSFLFNHVFINECVDDEKIEKYEKLINDMKLSRSGLKQEGPLTRITQFTVGGGAS